jgi:hypothetical protein
MCIRDRARSANLDDMYGGSASPPSLLLRPRTNVTLQGLARDILVKTYALLARRLPMHEHVVKPDMLYRDDDTTVDLQPGDLPDVASWAETIKRQTALTPTNQNYRPSTDRSSDSSNGRFDTTMNPEITYVDLGVEAFRLRIAGLVRTPHLRHVLHLHDLAYTWLLHEAMAHNGTSGFDSNSIALQRFYRRGCLMQALRTDLAHQYAASVDGYPMNYVPDLTTRLRAPMALWETYTNKGSRSTTGWIECFKR